MRSMDKRILIALLLFMPSLCAWAEAQDHLLAHAAVDSFVRQQTASLPGKVTLKIGEIDNRLVLPKCEKFEAFLPSGSQLLGNTSVGVRCTGNTAWSIFVPVQIQTRVSLLVSTQSLPAGHVLSESDLHYQTLDITQTGGILDKQNALGKVLRVGISAGQVLKEDMLHAPFSVTQGQTVQLVARGEHFDIRSVGVALNNASAGQIVKIRSDAGKVVSGLARASGVVEIVL